MTETLSIADYDVDQLRVGLEETLQLLDKLAYILNPHNGEDLLDCARNTVAEMRSGWKEITRLQAVNQCMKEVFDGAIDWSRQRESLSSDCKDLKIVTVNDWIAELKKREKPFRLLMGKFNQSQGVG